MRLIDEEKLNKVYEYIQEFQYKKRRSPTYKEIADGCGINSTAWVQSLIKILEEREMIELEKVGDKHRISVPENLSVGAIKNTSIVGNCSCGEPIFAVENIVSTVALPTDIFGSDDVFMLKAQGQSMINRGINNGDLMVVKIQDTANIGDVVIALINGAEATTKVFAKSRGEYYLKPANNETDENGKRIYKDIHPIGDWKIIGVVKYVIHKL